MRCLTDFSFLVYSAELCLVNQIKCYLSSEIFPNIVKMVLTSYTQENAKYLRSCYV